MENKYPYPWSNYGYCNCCDKPVSFIADDSWYRDNYLCSNCKCRPRERALMYVLEELFPNYENMYIHESSPIRQGASLKLKEKCHNYIETQYCCGHKFGEIVNGFRNENLESQTFQDESFDLIITQDVMEHIPDPNRAFKEISRTLRHGGAHIFTVPLVNKGRETQKWSTINDKNELTFIHTPDYHGEFPVTYHYGYDIVDLIYKSSELITQIFVIDNLNYGIRAQLVEVLVSTKR
jgi:SAM-dependent methyltransferase